MAGETFVPPGGGRLIRKCPDAKAVNDELDDVRSPKESPVNQEEDRGLSLSADVRGCPAVQGDLGFLRCPVKADRPGRHWVRRGG
jgi:hypothetical protein